MLPKTAKNFQYRDSREKTFANGTKVATSKLIKKWEHEVPSIASLVDNGFYYTPTRKNPDQCTCFWCGKKENDIVGVRAVASHHLRTSPKCAYGLIQSNMELYVSAPDKEEYWKLLAEEGRAPKSVTDPHSKESTALRASTFKNLWELDSHENCTATSTDLAKAGLYYSPLDEDNDRVICMYCDCPLDHWEAGDNPLEEHKLNAYAYCYFLLTLSDEGESTPVKKKPVKKKQQILPDDSLEDIDDSELSLEKSTPSPVKATKKTNDSFSSPLNESISNLPTRSPSSDPEHHKTSEFDTYDFSIENIEDPDHNSIFDDGKKSIYTRKLNVKKPLPPPPASLRQKATKKSDTRNSFIMQVDTSKETNHSAAEPTTTDSVVHVESQSFSTSISGKSSKSLSSEFDGTEGDLVEVVEELQDVLPDEISEYEDFSDGKDLSYHDETQTPSSGRKTERTNKRKLDSETHEDDRESSANLSSQSMNSDRFRQIIASPGKSKKVKLQNGQGALKIKEDLLDLSGHNIDDFNESNISYFESNARSSRRNSEAKSDLLQKDKSFLVKTDSVKTKKSAFDDDDDDFNFFAQRPKKANPPHPDINMEETTKGIGHEKVDGESGAESVKVTPENLADNIGIEDIEPSSSLLKDGEVEKDLQPSISEGGHSSEGTKRASNDEEQNDIDNDDAPDAMDVDKGVTIMETEAVESEVVKTDHTGKKIDGGETTEKIRSHKGEETSIIPEEHKELEIEKDVAESKDHGQEDNEQGSSPVSKHSSADASTDKFVDTRADFDGESVFVGQLDADTRDVQEPDDIDVEFEEGTDISLSPSSYASYVKDMRSMEDEFVDASAIQEGRGGNLLIDQSLKTNMLDKLVEDVPAKVNTEQDLVVFDYRDEVAVRTETVSSVITTLQGLKTELTPDLSKSEVSTKQSSEIGQEENLQSERLEVAENGDSKTELGELQKVPVALGRSSNDNSEREDNEEEEEEQSLVHEESSVAEERLLNEPGSSKRLSSPKKATSHKMISSPGEQPSSEKPLTPAKDPNSPKEAPSARETMSGDHRSSPAKNNRRLVVYPLELPEQKGHSEMSSPAYNESPHNRTFIQESLSVLASPVAEPTSTKDDMALVGVERARPESFIESSTPQKKSKENASRGFPRIEIARLGNIDEELKTLKDTMEYLSEVSSVSCELHNDTEGILTDFIAAMPEEEEMMTIKEWMQHNAATCGRTVRAIADRMIDVYENEFEKLIEHIEKLPTVD